MFTESKGSGAESIAQLSLENGIKMGRLTALLEASNAIFTNIPRITSVVTDPRERLQVMEELTKLAREISAGK